MTDLQTGKKPIIILYFLSTIKVFLFLTHRSNSSSECESPLDYIPYRHGHATKILNPGSLCLLLANSSCFISFSIHCVFWSIIRDINCEFKISRSWTSLPCDSLRSSSIPILHQWITHTSWLTICRVHRNIMASCSLLLLLPLHS